MKSLFLLIIAGTCSAAEPQLAASRAQSELEALLSKIINPERFMVQVNTTIATVSERRIVEGENITDPQPPAPPRPPALPGFVPPIGRDKPAAESSRRRQVFKTVERDVLKNITAQITLDQQLPNETIVDAKRMVRRYLDSAYGDKAVSGFVLVKMLTEPPYLISLLALWPWALTALLLIAALMGLVLVAKKLLSNKARLQAQTTSLPQSAENSVLPPAVTEEPWRDNALQLISANALAFRGYFQRLSENDQSEFCAALQGPSLDALFEAMGLQKPSRVGAENSDAVRTKLANFKTYLFVNKWRHEQLFGFLNDLPQAALLSLVRGEKPLLAATAIKFMQPSQSAAILNHLSSDERKRLLAHSAEADLLSSNELASIDRTLRTRVTQTPMTALAGGELEFWSNILSQSDDDSLLDDVRAARPELAARLGRFAFKLDRLSELPLQTVAKVLDEVDNDELALALLTCSREVTHHALTSLSDRRRTLLLEQMTALTQSPSDTLTTARRNLTHRFREVLT